MSIFEAGGNPRYTSAMTTHHYNSSDFGNAIMQQKPQFFLKFYFNEF